MRSVYVPIYEYACRSCGHQFETIQKASEPVLTDCPACGEASLKKLLSAPVFRLKGSGWYETDFKTGDKKNVSDNGESDRTDRKADDGQTNAAGSRMDDDGLVGGQIMGGKEHVVGGQHLNRKGRTLLKTDRVGQGHDLAG